MKYLKIIGKHKLSGEVKISGAKNAALPLLASTILAKNELVIGNMPDVVDTNTLLKLLEKLGATYKRDKNTVTLNTLSINKTKATYDIVNES